MLQRAAQTNRSGVTFANLIYSVGCKLRYEYTPVSDIKSLLHVSLFTIPIWRRRNVFRSLSDTTSLSECFWLNDNDCYSAADFIALVGGVLCWLGGSHVTQIVRPSYLSLPALSRSRRQTKPTVNCAVLSQGKCWYFWVGRGPGK